MDNRKEEIIEVALRRFCHYGFSKTTMNEVADDLNVTKANLYYYYQDKTALINDVIRYVSSAVHASEQEILDKYNHDFLGTLIILLELRSTFVSKYYMLSINENLEWIKGLNVTEVIEEVHKREFDMVLRFFEFAVVSGDVKLKNVSEAVQSYIEVNKALTLMFNMQDIITGLPNRDNVKKILESQIRVTKLIFEDKIVTKK